jgi:hypothetical protein
MKHILAVASKYGCITGTIYVIASRATITRCYVVFMIDPKLAILGSGQALVA